MTLQADRDWCWACCRETAWRPVRGGRRLRCKGCGAEFPCRSEKCGHEDCIAVRVDQIEQEGQL